MDEKGGSIAEILEQVVGAQGRLLQVDRTPVAGPAGVRASSLLRLTFDVGILTLRPGEEGSGIEVQIGTDGKTGSALLLGASEDDPWWTVMGCTLARVQRREPGGVSMQFRGDEENPRRFALFAREGGIEVWLDD